MNHLLTILEGDCIDQLRALPDESVHCCVTSPPYWGLRDYGTARWEGGSADCDHRKQLGGEGETSAKQNTSTGTQTHQYRDVCGKCGAKRIDNQIGLEPTPQEYVAKLVAVFAEVWRVLRDDGTLWLNLGDSYCGGNTGNQTNVGQRYGDGKESNGHVFRRDGKYAESIGLQSKQIIGIPWRVAFALQTDGWWLRQDIIWSKPNAMPESVTDRCTKAHEYIFLLTKRAKYFYDSDAIKEPVAISQIGRVRDDIVGGASFVERGQHSKGGSYRGSSFDRGKTAVNQHGKGQPNENRKDPYGLSPIRNKRSVWTVPTAPYSEAHFATFPPDLIKPCILAGCPVGGTVLDPFGGSGTTGQVALELGRKAILIELNPKYVELMRNRTNVTPGFCFT